MGTDQETVEIADIKITTMFLLKREQVMTK
jgi:hypothetical protein